jgi:hypothetical protein
MLRDKAGSGAVGLVAARVSSGLGSRTALLGPRASLRARDAGETLMRSCLRTSCFALVLFACATDDVELKGVEQAVGPQDPDGDPPSCGEDGICRINECDDDPDCDLPEPSNTPPAVWSLSGPVHRTAVSGELGTDVFTLGTPTDATRGVYALLSRERSNDPCHFAIGVESVNDERSDSAPELNLCGATPTSSTLHADYLDVTAGGSYDHSFVSGVTVCMNALGDKVKGISVSGRKLLSNGALIAASTVGSSPRPNCDSWSAWATCPSGQIVTAIDAHFQPDNGPTGGPFPPPRSLSGIALHCRTVSAQ